MPQLDAAFYPGQLLWLVVSFATFYFLLAKRIVPRITATLEARRAHIDARLRAAEQAQAQVVRLSEEYARAMDEARARAQAVLRRQADASARAGEKRQREMGNEIEARLRQAEERIALRRRQALAEAPAAAAEVAAQALMRLSDLTADDAALKKAVALAAKRTASEGGNKRDI